jgi:hypothetical protein
MSSVLSNQKQKLRRNRQTAQRWNSRGHNVTWHDVNRATDNSCVVAIYLWAERLQLLMRQVRFRNVACCSTLERSGITWGQTGCGCREPEETSAYQTHEGRGRYRQGEKWRACTVVSVRSRSLVTVMSCQLSNCGLSPGVFYTTLILLSGLSS